MIAGLISAASALADIAAVARRVRRVFFIVQPCSLLILSGPSTIAGRGARGATDPFPWVRLAASLHGSGKNSPEIFQLVKIRSRRGRLSTTAFILLKNQRNQPTAQETPVPRSPQ